jgi:uncharacterized protein YjbI with pentapeptide repeats
MSSAVRGSSRVAVLCVFGFTALIVACGGGATSDGCDQSSKEKPLSNLDVASCKNWDLKFGTATLVPNDVILQANMFNDVSDFKSWIVVEAYLRYKGTDTGRISDAISSSAFLVGSKNLTYAANDKTPTFSELKDAFAPIPYNASSPYSGGTVKISMWFWVDNDDSNFLLGLFVGDKEADKPNLWIDVSTSNASDEGVSEGAVSEGTVDCVRGLEDFELSLEGCDFSNREFVYLMFSSNINDNSRFYDRNLTNVNFSGATLRGKVLDCSNLTGANLEGATLSESQGFFVNMSGANLRGANLGRIDVLTNKLSWSNFANADLSGANLSWADLTGANLTGAILDQTILDGADLTDVVYDDPFWRFEDQPYYEKYCRK